MTIDEAIEVLREHNAWRRGAKIEQLSPERITRAIELGVGALHACAAKKTIEQRFVFTDELRAARNAKGWSLQKAAGELGISKPHLHELEKGTARNPTGKVIAAIVRVYGLDPAAVIGSLQ